MNYLFKKYKVKINFSKDSIAKPDLFRKSAQYSSFKRDLSKIDKKQNIKSLFSKRLGNKMKKNVIIYGASSLISLELIKLLDKDVSRFFLFCREKNEIENFLTNNNFDIKKFSYFRG
jgi:hypothetical protein